MSRWQAGYEEFVMAATAGIGGLHPLIFGLLLLSIAQASVCILLLVSPMTAIIVLYCAARIRGGNHAEALAVLRGKRSWKVPKLVW